MSEFLAEASVKIVPDTSGFRRQLVTQLTAETAAAEKQLAGATRTATVATGQQAVVQRKAAAAAAVETAELRAQQKQLIATAAAHEQLARGAGATGLSLLGARGATLAAGSSFLIGAAAVTLLAKSVKGAIDDEETLFRVQKVLGAELGAGSKEWSRTLAASFGIADDAALKYEGSIAETLHNAGILPAQNAKLSQTFVELAADMAAFAHVPVENTLKALQLAVSGNARSLRQYGVVIQNSEVQQRALAATGKETVRQLTQQELTLARIGIIFDKTRNQVGSFAQNQDSLANKAKILNATLDSLGDSAGRLAIGPLSILATVASHLASNLDKLASAGERTSDSHNKQSGVLRVLNAALEFSDKQYEVLIGLTKRADKATADLGETFGIEAVAMNGTTLASQSLTQTLGTEGLAAALAQVRAESFAAIPALEAVGQTAAVVAGQINAAVNALFASLGGLAGGVQEAVVQAQIGGGGLQAVLRAQEAAVTVATANLATATVAAATGFPTDVQARRAAEQKLKEAQDAVAATRAEIAAAKGAGGGGGGGGAKGPSAQDLLDEADKRLLTEQELARSQVQITKTKAQRTKSLVDDIAADKKEIALLDQQIKDAQKIHDKTLRRQTIQQLTADRLQTEADLRDTEAQQRQNIRDRKVTAAENAVRSAELDAELARTLNKPKAQIAALQRENAALERERQLWKGNTIKQKEIRNQIAENNQTIKDIRHQTDNRAAEFKALEFQFLQTQAGFAANLLSNLLPVGAVAGTVGGGGISTPTAGGPGPAGFATAAHQRPGLGGGVAAQAQISASKGATSGQMSQLIHIQSLTLNAILRLVGQRTHPEAKGQAVGQATSTDYIPYQHA